MRNGSFVRVLNESYWCEKGVIVEAFNDDEIGTSFSVKMHTPIRQLLLNSKNPSILKHLSNKSIELLFPENTMLFLQHELEEVK